MCVRSLHWKPEKWDNKGCCPTPNGLCINITTIKRLGKAHVWAGSLMHFLWIMSLNVPSFSEILLNPSFSVSSVYLTSISYFICILTVLGKMSTLRLLDFNLFNICKLHAITGWLLPLVNKLTNLMSTYSSFTQNKSTKSLSLHYLH